MKPQNPRLRKRFQLFYDLYQGKNRLLEKLCIIRALKGLEQDCGCRGLLANESASFEELLLFLYIILDDYLKRSNDPALQESTREATFDGQYLLAEFALQLLLSVSTSLENKRQRSPGYKEAEIQNHEASGIYP